jgi:hypothetical protein
MEVYISGIYLFTPRKVLHQHGVCSLLYSNHLECAMRIMYKTRDEVEDLLVEGLFLCGV